MIVVPLVVVNSGGVFFLKEDKLFVEFLHKSNFLQRNSG